MAIKKKEKVAAGKRSDAIDSRKSGDGSIAVQSKSTETKNGKTSSTKMGNVAKMKSDGTKEVKRKGDEASLLQTVAEAGQFLNEVKVEARKITWPDRAQVIRETVSVLFLVTLITIFVWLFDLLLGKFVFAPVEHWAHLYGIGGS